MTEMILAEDTPLDTPRPALAHLRTMPRVDLTPHEFAADAALKRLKNACIGAVVVSAVVVGSLWSQGHHEADERKKDLSAAEQTQSGVQGQVSALSYVTSTFASVTAAQKLEAQALGGEVRWSQQMNDLSMSAPAGVWLTNMTVAAATPAVASAALSSTTAAPIATVTFQGVALEAKAGDVGSARDRVASWLEFLTAHATYADATYSTSVETTLGTQAVVNFTSTVSVTPAALSNRYSSGG